MVASDDKCPICGSNQIRQEPVFGPAYRECHQCGFLWRVDRENFPNPNEAYQDTDRHIEYLVQQEVGDARRVYCQIQLTRLHRYVQPPGRLLELGCGTGGLSKAAMEAGWEVVALDSSPALCRHAERLLGAEHVIQASMETVQIEADAFDAVIALDFIEHLPDITVLPRRVGQWLREGGILMLQTPNARALRRYLQRRRWNQLKPEQHYLFHTSSSLRLLLAREGFEVLSLGSVSGSATAGLVHRALTAVYGNALALLGIGNTLSLIARTAKGSGSPPPP